MERERNGEALSLTISKAGAISFEATTALLWAGLLHEDGDLTLDQVADWIEPPLADVLNPCVEALQPWIETKTEPAPEGKADLKAS